MTICEFCYKKAPKDTLGAGWDIVWQSFVCPECQKRVKEDGGYGAVKCGAYSTKADPRGNR